MRALQHCLDVSQAVTALMLAAADGSVQSRLKQSSEEEREAESSPPQSQVDAWRKQSRQN